MQFTVNIPKIDYLQKSRNFQSCSRTNGCIYDVRINEGLQLIAKTEWSIVFRSTHKCTKRLISCVFSSAKPSLCIIRCKDIICTSAVWQLAALKLNISSEIILPRKFYREVHQIICNTVTLCKNLFYYILVIVSLIIRQGFVIFYDKINTKKCLWTTSKKCWL